MRYSRGVTVLATGALCVALAVVVRADTLVMKDGQRVDGRLVTVHEGVIEFDARRGFFRTERLRLDRRDVRAIELEEERDDRGPDRDLRPGTGSRSGSRRPSLGAAPARRLGERGGRVERHRRSRCAPARRSTSKRPARCAGDPGARTAPAAKATRRAIPAVRFPTGRAPRSSAASATRILSSSATIAARSACATRGACCSAINDDFLRDNSGAFRVTIYY